MTYKTKGIVLKTIKYGETSLVVSIFTELFGIQSYMVNGVRTSKKGSNKAALYQPSAILELMVYHNELKNMQRIKEASWAVIFEHTFSDVFKNCISLYMVELLYKSLKQPEANEDLFNFCEDAFVQLDKAESNIAANFPLYFTLHLTHFFGFRISDELSSGLTSENIYLDFVDGNFVNEQPAHPYFLSGENALITSQLLKVMQIQELDQIKLKGNTRKLLLLKYHEYYSLHIQDFGQLKTLRILHEVLS